ncbi:hypothetical protein V5O48_015880 [Marasmius crinis-equi]|uniref:Tyr recombinase domain-containing protein n=1 Tax=Marasmius crinis-equi TaxID=585013 RepID=A0ABR3ET94_9AGAR
MPQTRSQQFKALQNIYCSMDASTTMEAEDDMLAEQDVAEAFTSQHGVVSEEGFPGYENYNGIAQPDNDVNMSESIEDEGAIELDGLPEPLQDVAKAPLAPDTPLSSGTPSIPVVESTKSKSSISKVVNENAKGASEQTTASYERLMKQLEDFVRERKLVPEGNSFVSTMPCKDSPDIICAWIMKQCDSIDLDTGEAKPVEEERSSFSHAQKMRAAATDVTGEMAGNPSVSEKVSMYMVSLHRRKVQAGEEPTSARAITTDMIRLMYNYARKPENWIVKPFEQRHRATADPDEWGGPKFRRLLLLAYNIAFLCLLRVDEVLNIRMQDIRLMTDEDGQRMLKLTLPFRKTNQFGNIKPFYLRELPEELKHLCPVRAFAEWINTTKIKKGYLFPKLTKTDRLHLNDVPMTSQQFLEGFRNNLIDIGIDPAPYGTHSFRRGGCQWLSVYLRWSLRKLCEWGGWSMDFSNMTIVKYLISWNDDPMYPRENFFKIDRPQGVICFMCGRSCECFGL